MRRSRVWWSSRPTLLPYLLEPELKSLCYGLSKRHRPLPWYEMQLFVSNLSLRPQCEYLGPTWARSLPHHLRECYLDCFLERPGWGYHCLEVQSQPPELQGHGRCRCSWQKLVARVQFQLPYRDASSLSGDCSSLVRMGPQGPKETQNLCGSHDWRSRWWRRQPPKSWYQMPRQLHFQR